MVNPSNEQLSLVAPCGAWCPAQVLLDEITAELDMLVRQAARAIQGYPGLRASQIGVPSGNHGKP